MAKFIISLQKTLANEGGYINDHDDLGGETYKGIARNAHSSWDGWQIIDSQKNNLDFPQSLDSDFKLQNLVEKFYLDNFWDALNIEQIQNQSNANSFFDFAVNSGSITAARMIQSIVGVKIDGIIGTQSLYKINFMEVGYFQAAFTLAKIKYYMNLIRKRPTNKKFLFGWITRALSFNN